MLRISLIVIVSTLFIGCLFVALHAGGPMIGPAIVLGFILLGLVFETFRYRTLSRRAPGGGFSATVERFIDPESGQLVEVHFDPATGARRYVVIGDAKDNTP
jgi:hypothetical protein